MTNSVPPPPQSGPIKILSNGDLRIGQACFPLDDLINKGLTLDLGLELTDLSLAQRTALEAFLQALECRFLRAAVGATYPPPNPNVPVPVPPPSKPIAPPVPATPNPPAPAPDAPNS